MFSYVLIILCETFTESIENLGSAEIFLWTLSLYSTNSFAILETYQNFSTFSIKSILKN